VAFPLTGHFDLTNTVHPTNIPTPNMNHDTLEHVKVGDKLLVESCGSYRNKSIANVTKVTATQIVTDGGRYLRTTGREVGRVGATSWSWRHAKAATPEDIAKLEAEQKRERLRCYITDKFSRSDCKVRLETMEQIERLINTPQ
jgi:hypothetical protein